MLFISVQECCAVVLTIFVLQIIVQYVKVNIQGEKMDSSFVAIAEEHQRSPSTASGTIQDILREPKNSAECISKVEVNNITEVRNPKSKAKVDFSIEAILSSHSTDQSKASQPSEMYEEANNKSFISGQIEAQFSWVYCTRYRPPKLPRVKRELGLRSRYRNPRIPFSTAEVSLLEKKFMQSPYLGSSDVNELAEALNMSPKRVKIWFQNRRARERRERETQ